MFDHFWFRQFFSISHTPTIQILIHCLLKNTYLDSAVKVRLFKYKQKNCVLFKIVCLRIVSSLIDVLKNLLARKYTEFFQVVIELENLLFAIIEVFSFFYENIKKLRKISIEFFFPFSSEYRDDAIRKNVK